MGKQIKIQNKLLSFLIDCLSFNTPKAIVFNLSSILLILAVIPTKVIVNLPTICIFKNFILPIAFKGKCPTSGLFANCECPACGLTRAMSSLLHGNLQAALGYNHLVIIVFIVMVFIIIINLIKIKRNS